tara:strand:+ start:231 stop:1124 length:894 start_codon:yes stop_codon:yes gene_type:complete
MSEYLDLITIFFNEKQLFLTDLKHKNCNGCDDHKIFIENNAEIIMSCGDPSSDKSKCGNKIRIILPIYKSDKDLRYLKIKLNEIINWDIIGKHIDVDPKLIKENQEYIEKYKEEVNKLKELFNKYNSDNYKKINENYGKIKGLKLECRGLLADIKQSDNIIKERELKKEYIEKTININTLFREIKEINMNEYYLVEDPKIPINNYEKYISEKPIKPIKPIKPVKKDKKDKKVKKVIKIDSGNLPNGSKVKWEKNGKEFNGIIEGDTAKSYRICCKPGKGSGEKGSTYLVPKNLVKLS